MNLVLIHDQRGRVGKLMMTKDSFGLILGQISCQALACRTGNQGTETFREPRRHSHPVRQLHLLDPAENLPVSSGLFGYLDRRIKTLKTEK